MVIMQAYRTASKEISQLWHFFMKSEFEMGPMTTLTSSAAPLL